ncbi:MAG: hypothetical protein LRY27_00250 [Chitinophagales bacterium]|nr:hypothetical protein [Chitinophagales bacterium]
MVTKAVKHYNHNRIHNAIERKTLAQFEKEIVNLPLQSRTCWLIIAR